MSEFRSCRIQELQNWHIYHDALHSNSIAPLLITPTPATPVLLYSCSLVLIRCRHRRMHQRVSVTCVPEFRPISPDRQINELPLERIKSDNAIKSFWS